MKKLLITFTASLFFSCGIITQFLQEDFDIKTSSAIEESERLINEEKRTEKNGIRDFSTKEKENIEIEDIDAYPELKDLEWKSSFAIAPGSPYAKKGGTFYTFLDSFPSTFRIFGPGVDEESKKLFETNIKLLTKSYYDRNFLPGIATHWAFGKDGKSVYYKLNKSARWSDGSPCMADDFLFALDFMKLKTTLPAFEEASNLSIRKITDEYIAITFNGNTYGSSDFLLEMTNISPRPKHFYNGRIPKNYVTEYNRKAEPTTGAYSLDEWDFVYGLIFKKVNGWWAESYTHFKNVYNFNSVIFRILPGGQSGARKYFKNGELDALPLYTKDDYIDAIEDARFKRGMCDILIHPYKSVQGLNGILFNTKAFPLNSLEFRRAMEYAIDIEGLVENALSGIYERCHTMGVKQNFNENSPIFNNLDIKMPKYDKQKAIEWLEKAGFNSLNGNGVRVNKEGKKASFTILYTDKDLREVAGYLYAKAFECGIELDFRFVSGGILNMIKAGNFQGWWANLAPSIPPNYYHLLHSVSESSPPYLSGLFGFSDATLDSLLEKGKTNGNKHVTMEEKIKINKQIEQIVRDNALFIPTYYRIVKMGLCWKYIRFPALSSMPYMEDLCTGFAPLLWFDKEIKEDVEEAFKEGFGFESRVWK